MPTPGPPAGESNFAVSSHIVRRWSREVRDEARRKGDRSWHEPLAFKGYPKRPRLGVGSGSSVPKVPKGVGALEDVKLRKFQRDIIREVYRDGIRTGLVSIPRANGKASWRPCWRWRSCSWVRRRRRSGGRQRPAAIEPHLAPGAADDRVEPERERARYTGTGSKSRRTTPR